jgi:hypothetical protein
VSVIAIMSVVATMMIVPVTKIIRARAIPIAAMYLVAMITSVQSVGLL